MRNKSIKRLFEIVARNKQVSYFHMSYHDQLKTNEWRYFRLYVIVVKGFKCELCDHNNFNHFQVHHKKYINGLMAWQYELKDLMILCKFHHEKVHMPEIIEKYYNKVKSINQIYNERI